MDKKPDKKKRGRKPKSKIVINENPIFSKNEKLDNLIVCIKEKNETYINNSSVDNLTDNIEINNLNNLNIEDTNNYEEQIITDANHTNCWNCTYGIINLNVVSIPIKYRDDIFYTYGNFCSYECSARFLFDNYKSKDLWEKYALLNLYYNKCRNTHNKIVSFAPDRLLLKKFGGNLEIDDYRNKNTHDVYDIYLPPIIPVNHKNHKFETRKQNELNDLKIYRKKTTSNKHNIFDTMNIKSQ